MPASAEQQERASAPGAAPEAGQEPAPDGAPGATDGTQAAQAAQADTRTADQIRADVLTDLLLTAAPAIDPTRTDDGPGTLGAIRARIQVVVPALSVLNPDDENRDPAQLIGHGPIDIGLAKQLAVATPVPWDRVITHPITGAVLRTDTYHRTAAIDQHVRARDRHCRMPGCALPAVSCEVDHTRDHALGGPTDVGNLATLCQRHHSMKQFTDWTVEQVGGGVLRWVSPAGVEYIDEPPAYAPTVRFAPDDPVPPGGPPDDEPPSWAHP